MNFIKKHLDYFIIASVIISLNILPITRFAFNYVKYLNDYGSDKMSIVEFWDYSLWQTFGMWLIILSPILIIIVSTIKFHRSVYQEELIIEEHDSVKVNRLRRLVKIA